MKKIITLLLLAFIPCVIFADSTYEMSVSTANKYIFNYSDYARYIIVTGNLPYGYENGKGKNVSEFTTGGLLTKEEYDISNSEKNSSYLSPGIQYWLMKNGNNLYKVDTNVRNATNSDTSGVRVTEYVAHNVKVKGTGSTNSPYEFIDGYIIKIGSSDNLHGRISPAEGYMHIDSNSEVSFTFDYDANYTVDYSDCMNTANKTGAEFERNGNNIKVKHPHDDFTCVISLGAGCYKVNFTNNGVGTGGMDGKSLYYRYGKGWFSNNTCSSAIKEEIVKPTRKGYNFVGYKGNGVTIIDSDAKIHAGANESRITNNMRAVAEWEPITYTISYDCNGGSGSTATSTHKFNEAKQLTPNGCSKTYNDFVGWAETSTGDKKYKDKDSVTNLADTQGANVKLYAKWLTKTTTWTYSYTGGSQSFTAPIKGKYSLEVWGAQGGKGGYGGSNSGKTGGYGGYSYGEVELNEGDTIYIYVGGKGDNASKNTEGPGGYNGGGNGGGSAKSSLYGGAGGGGATHISKTNKLLKDLSSSTGNILIVAGGGGGGGYYDSLCSESEAGGSGGGFSGNKTSGADAGTQTGGNAFGVGQNGRTGKVVTGQCDSEGNGGGGGGYYGGKSNQSTGQGTNTGGSGGSGYIGNSLLSNKYMYCYKCTTSDATATKTYSTEATTEGLDAKKARKGSGAARIKLINY